jgi:hypothetical protein
MTKSSIASEIHQALDALLHLATSVTFDLESGLDGVTERFYVRVAEIIHLLVGGDAGQLTDLMSCGAADAIDIRKSVSNLLAPGEIDSCNTCHNWSLTLPLLVAWVIANNPNDALSTDHLALLTNLLDARSYLHGLTSVILRLQFRGWVSLRCV